MTDTSTAELCDALLKAVRTDLGEFERLRDGALWTFRQTAKIENSKDSASNALLLAERYEMNRAMTYGKILGIEAVLRAMEYAAQGYSLSEIVMWQLLDWK